VALHHLPLEEERRAEEARRAADVPGGDQRADLGGGHGLALHVHHRHDLGLELGARAQELRVPPRALAKAEVLPHPARRRVQPADPHAASTTGGRRPPPASPRAIATTRPSCVSRIASPVAYPGTGRPCDTRSAPPASSRSPGRKWSASSSGTARSRSASSRR